MEVLNLEVNPVTVDFRGSSITYNADAFTPEFFRNAATKFREEYERAASADKQMAAKRKKAKGVERIALDMEESARFLEIDRDIYSLLLVGTPACPVLLKWDWTADGKPIPITVKELRKRKPKLVKELYDFISDAAHPKKTDLMEAKATE